MRAVFIGLSNLTMMTAKSLVEHGSEVVIIESDKQKIDAASDELDAGYLHGDGSKPAVLKDAGPSSTGVLYCLTDNDQMNIIAGLVARSLGFPKIVVKIEEPELELICLELGLENTIIPTMTASRILSDMAFGRDVLEISAMIKGEARFFSLLTDADSEGPVDGLDLPKNARAVMYYRDGEFHLVEEDTALKKGDEVVVLTHCDNINKLREKWYKDKPEKG
jgi:trk system potassium uptake protein TrkA